MGTLWRNSREIPPMGWKRNFGERAGSIRHVQNVRGNTGHGVEITRMRQQVWATVVRKTSRWCSHLSPFGYRTFAVGWKKPSAETAIATLGIPKATGRPSRTMPLRTETMSSRNIIQRAGASIAQALVGNDGVTQGLLASMAKHTTAIG